MPKQFNIYDTEDIELYDFDELETAVKPEDDSWNITRGLKSGVLSTVATVPALGSLAAKAVGWESGAEALAKPAMGLMKRAEEYRPDVSFEELVEEPTLGGAVDWALYTIGNFAPSMLVGFGGAGIGAKIASKMAIKKAIKREVKKGLTKKAAANAIVKKAIQKSTLRGAKVGIVTSTAGLEGGHMYMGDVARHGVKEAKVLPHVLLGTAAGAVELGFGGLGKGHFRLIEKFYGKAAKETAKKQPKIALRMLSEIGRQSGGEAFQELSQEEMAMLNEYITARPEERGGLTPREHILRGAESFLGGGLMGLGGGMISPAIPSQQVAPETLPAEEVAPSEVPPTEVGLREREGIPVEMEEEYKEEAYVPAEEPVSRKEILLRKFEKIPTKEALFRKYKMPPKTLVVDLSKKEAPKIASQWNKIYRTTKQEERRDKRLKDAQAIVDERPDLFKIAHTMPDGTIMEGIEHEEAVEGSTKLLSTQGFELIGKKEVKPELDITAKKQPNGRYKLFKKGTDDLIKVEGKQIRRSFKTAPEARKFYETKLYPRIKEKPPVEKEVAEPEYVYHGTSEGAFRQIRKQGMEEKEKYFSGDEQYARTYAERKGVLKEPRILRIKKTADIIPDERIVEEGDFKTKRKIPTEEIEVKVGKKWIPIQEYYDESINIMPIAPAKPTPPKPKKPTPPEAVEKEIKAKGIPEVAPKRPFEPDLAKLPLKDITIETKAIREKTGETIVIKENAKEAIDRVDKQIEDYHSILECL